MTEEIVVPWKSFKAFVQLYDISGMPYSIPPPKEQWRHELLLYSSKIQKGTFVPLLVAGLVEFRGDEGAWRVLKGVPLGRVHPEWLEDPIVAPQSRSDAGRAWNLTNGKCAFCGLPLAFQKRLALGSPEDELNGARLLSCKSCHSKRKNKSLEDFRFMLQMESFEKDAGVKFNRQQVAWLAENGFQIALPKHVFYYEQQQEA